MRKALVTQLKKTYAHRHTLWKMASAQLKSKYVSSWSGVWLAIIQPLLIMGAISFVFTYVFHIEIERFPLFALAGIFPWLFISSALSEATTSFLQKKALTRQFSIPYAIIPLSVVLSQFMNFLIGWCVLYPLFCLFNPRIILLFPLFAIVLFLTFFFTSGLALGFSVCNVFFRDLEHLLGVFLMFWFWVTPVFYSADMVMPQLRWICVVNPLTPFIELYRNVLFLGTLPSPYVVAGVFAWTALSWFCGFTLFAQLQSSMLKEI
ncbi:MAG: ABC transporter permease [Candidatus Omnitrophota bacterium]